MRGVMGKNCENWNPAVPETTKVQTSNAAENMLGF